MTEVYLDNSATTRPSQAVIAAVQKCLTEEWFNPSALYRPAMMAQKQIDRVRSEVASAAGAQNQQVIFTSCGTEADNLAIFGCLRNRRKPGKVLLLQTEHPAVLSCAQEIERLGHTVQLIPVDSVGRLKLDQLEAMLDETVHLICVMQVNNETGTIQPLEEVAALRNRLAPNAAIHVDGVQGFLRVPLSFNRLGIQSYAISGHKIHAMKGIGALIVQKGHRLAPILLGGGQENGLRSGTENVPGILSLGEAVRSYPSDGAARMAKWKKALWEQLNAALPGIRLNGPAIEDGAPHILNISFQPVRSQTMLFALEGDGIYVSAGSACASKKQKISPVLSAMGLDTQRADCAIRFSLSPDLTDEQRDYVVDRLVYHVTALKPFTRR